MGLLRILSGSCSARPWRNSTRSTPCSARSSWPAGLPLTSTVRPSPSSKPSESHRYDFFLCDLVPRLMRGPVRAGGLRHAFPRPEETLLPALQSHHEEGRHQRATDDLGLPRLLLLALSFLLSTIPRALCSSLFRGSAPLDSTRTPSSSNQS